MSKRRLAVTRSDDVTPISHEHNLLVGFHFGAAPTPNEYPAIVSTGLDPIGRGDVFECWWYKGDVDFTTRGNARISQCEDYAVTVLQQPDSAPEEFQVRSYHAYLELLRAVPETEHRNLIKIWNYFAGINEGQEDREKYRQFSIGRARAFEEYGVLDGTIPTGTAIGNIRSAGLSVIAVTSKHEFHSAENPRQVSAFQYPRQYGPRSPKFSRGGYVSTDNDNLFVISGTAAIIGHESVHPYDVRLQTSETLENLDHLCRAMSGLRAEGPHLVLDKDSVLRVYLRDLNDMDFVAQQLTELLGNIESSVVFLHADICRRELMVEIDGIRVLS
jgi:chorismate lyase/3-hydroxybenzoate synthase